MMGDYLYTYKGRNTEVDEDAHIQHDEFLLELKKAKFESAIDPYDVLGEGAEYGVIANKYIQANDSETNFAAKVFENRTDHYLKVGEGGSVGDGVVPFYVGRVEGNNDLRFGSEITVDLDVYINENQEDRAVKNPAGHYEVTKYPMTESAIDAVVDGFIDKLGESSTNYKGKSDIKAEGRELDTTSLPDNVTIYVDASDFDLAHGGWKLKKLEGQTIVFNIPGSNVKIEGSSQKTFEIYKRDENTGALEKVVDIDSNTGGNGGDSGENELLEKYILNHIVYNAYDATYLDLSSGPAGLFLAPNAFVYESTGSGTGWVATGGEFHQKGGEWHFFRTQRKYKSKGDFSLSGQKKIMDGTTAKDYSEFSSMTFTFDLFECEEEEDGTIAEGTEGRGRNNCGRYRIP